ncbi:MAG: DNA-directed RNA polymerase subunit beta [Alphaproteobacteria bacterium]
MKQYNIRHSFGKIKSPIKLPNFIELQEKSFEDFLQAKLKPEDRKNQGLQSVFNDIFPIIDSSSGAELQFVKYDLDNPEFSVEQCLKRDMNYAMRLRVSLRLISFDIDEKTKKKTIRDIKEQYVFLGDTPVMTPKGSFVVNGIERVVLSQLQRSPGVFFSHDNGKKHESKKIAYSVRVIPSRGSWLDFEFDHKDVLFVRIDRKRKLPATALLYSLFGKNETFEDFTKEDAVGMTTREILETFYKKDVFKKTKDGWIGEFSADKVKTTFKMLFDLVDAKTKKVLLKKGQRLTPNRAKKITERGLKEYFVSSQDLVGRFVLEPIVNPQTKEVLFNTGEEITAEGYEAFERIGIKEITLLNADGVNVGFHMVRTINTDKSKNRKEALSAIYQVVRPGELANTEASAEMLKRMFFDNVRFDLSDVGRFKMNRRLGITDVGEECGVLRKEDIIIILKKLLEIKDGKEQVDDIDSLANRRISPVGEQLTKTFRSALLRLDRIVKERLSNTNLETAMPQDLVNARPVIAVINEFFGLNQMSQILEQTNPLAELTHKRRISALGTGGLTRERAGYEVRDVHATHYGRLCPIESPEGPNIGLIASLANYAKVNNYGFLETPYRKVVNGKVSDEIIYLSALEEPKFVIAQGNAVIGKDGKFIDEDVLCRQGGDYLQSVPSEIDYMDVSPKQIISAATATIPFLAHDDANRALMGTNMSRQAVPLIKTEAPMVGTGIERKIVKDSKTVSIAKNDGVVLSADANKIIIKIIDSKTKEVKGVDIYTLGKFVPTNKTTCMNQKPLVKVGEKVQKGDVIADGASTDKGEIALGKNILIAFMSWSGYNYEDSILISERLVKDDVLTSIHIKDFEVQARDTKLGAEEFTRDIPNLSERALRNLDESGIVTIGSEVSAGDILVGRVTPKGETQLTSEEKLLRAIFGEKATDVKDTSLRVPIGAKGTVVDVRTFCRKGVKKDERMLIIEQQEIEKLKENTSAEKRIFEEAFREQVLSISKEAVLSKVIKGLGKKGEKIREDRLVDLPTDIYKKLSVESTKVQEKLNDVSKTYASKIEEIEEFFNTEVDKLRRGDSLMPGVLKSVKVYIADKKKIQAGDKIAGRHGNKGVISRVMPVEDMPYMKDGTPIDIVLTPMGVPSRMNIGQVLETHLGWASRGLGQEIGKIVNQIKKSEATDTDLKDFVKEIYTEDEFSQFAKLSKKETIKLGERLEKGVPFATPAFDGAKEADIDNLLEKANLDKSGQVELYDGRTGEKFDRKVTVGYMYMLKLHHLADEKMHARSVGPYSLVTQQPLGGKPNMGGQRMGEMEVWALEAHGASHLLQEMLTVKSDDVAGRTKVYESIVRGQYDFEAGVPESFNVLVKEMMALGLNVELKKK